MCVTIAMAVVWRPHHGDAVLLRVQVSLLGLLQQLLPAADGQQDGLCVAAVVQTQVHRPLEVPHQQGLADQPVSV